MSNSFQNQTDLVKAKINERFDSLYGTTSFGTYQPYVCIVCDEFLDPNSMVLLSKDLLRKSRFLLKPSQWNEVSIEIAKCYQYNCNIGQQTIVDNIWIQDLLLSPRATYICRTNNETKEGFTGCTLCKCSLEQSRMPKFAVANNY